MYGCHGNPGSLNNDAAESYPISNSQRKRKVVRDSGEGSEFQITEARLRIISNSYRFVPR